MLFTLDSAESYLAFSVAILFFCFLKNPKKPFSSSSAVIPFSWVTSPAIISPNSPKSLVFTDSRAESEKEEIFCCAAAPYWRMAVLSVTSIFFANSSTTFFSSSVSVESISTGSASVWAGAAACSCAACAAALPKGSRVREGICCLSIS